MNILKIRRSPILPAFIVALALSACSQLPHVSHSSLRLPASEGRLSVGGGVELFYRVIGEGKDTVVIVHGGVSGLNTLETDLLPLARGRTLLFYDQRGFGYSTMVLHDSLNTWQHAVADLDAVRKHFRLERLTLLGHSWGGLLVGLYAMTHPNRSERMVLIGASSPNEAVTRGQFRPSTPLDSVTNSARLAHLASWRSGRTDSVKACWDYWQINGRNFYGSPEQARRGWCDICNVPQATLLNPVRTAASRSLGRYNFSDQMASVTAPTLVIHGNRDPVPLSAAQTWVDVLKQARLFIMPESGHLPHVDNPEIFFPAVDAFLRGIWPDPPQPDGAWKLPKANISHSTAELTPYERLFDDLSAISKNVASAISAGDWQRAASLYTSDALLFASATPPITGRYAIAAFWHAAHGKGLRKVELQTMEVEGIGDMAIELGKYVIRGEAEQILDIGKFMAILRRDTDGWRLYRDMFNSSLETRSTLEVPDHLPPPIGTWTSSGRH